MPQAFVVGLTGGIGSGKSAAADMFADLGAALVDTDHIAHALTGPGGAAMTAIRAAFGNGVLTEDGALNRAAMRALAFESQDARKRLEGILHPMIRQESERQCLAASAPYVILAVPL
ncbi:MAG: dephospho-CoA kinase, partial [Zoogloea sp.]|nr:dephospho-CoA kinase [Zoogloea sp.]